MPRLGDGQQETSPPPKPAGPKHHQPGAHLLPVPPPQVLQLPVLLLPHRLQLSLMGPAQALQLSRQVP